MLLAYHVKSKAGFSLTDENSRLFMYSRLYGESLFQKHTTGGYSVWGSIIKCSTELIKPFAQQFVFISPVRFDQASDDSAFV